MKYTIEITAEMKSILDQLVWDLDAKTYAQIFRQGVALLLVAQKTQEEGKTLSITEDGKIEADLVF